MNKQKGFGEFFVIVVIAFLFIWFILAITGPETPKPANELQTSNEIQKEVVRSVPVPQITTSLERENVSRRATIFNAADKISYIYLVNYGKVMAFYTVQGKVSSLRSYMTPTEKIVTSRGTNCEDVNGCTTGYIVSAPDIDGTYGENVSGIFFFTTEGAYVEWNGDYMVSDQPLRLTTPPELVRQIQ